jgi:hypothetical protein
MKARHAVMLALVLCGVVLLPATAGGGASAGASAKTWRALVPLVSRNYPGVCTLAPAPIWPTGGQTIGTLAPEFSFAPYTALANYRYIYLQYSESQSFSPYSEYRIPSAISRPYTVTPFSNLTPGRTYYWRLREDCGSYRAGPWSRTASFTTPSGGTPPGQVTLQSPADDSTGMALQIGFSWGAVAGATRYKITLARAGYSPTVIFYTTTSCGLGGFQPNTEYAWWVTALNDYAYGPESAHWTFHTRASGAAEAEPERGAEGIVLVAADDW